MTGAGNRPDTANLATLFALSLPGLSGFGLIAYTGLWTGGLDWFLVLSASVAPICIVLAFRRLRRDRTWMHVGTFLAVSVDLLWALFVLAIFVAPFG
jgi:hypothetical protein